MCSSRKHIQPAISINVRQAERCDTFEAVSSIEHPRNRSFGVVIELKGPRFIDTISNLHEEWNATLQVLAELGYIRVGPEAG